MEDVERLLKNTVDELERLLSAKNVLGEPIERNGATVIPLVGYGFGFGAGGGTGTGNEGSKAGTGAGTGAGGGIKPVGAIIIDDAGARVEAVKGAVSSIAEVLGDTAAKVMKGRAGSSEPGAG